MSKVSAYVQSKEGHWYQDPVIEDDGWFICWDDDDPIELIIADDSGLKPQTICRRMKEQGWSLSITSVVETNAQRIFKGKFKPARAYFLEQRHNGPTDQILKGNKRLAREPACEGVYYMNVTQQRRRP